MSGLELYVLRIKDSDKSNIIHRDSHRTSAMPRCKKLLNKVINNSAKGSVL